MARMTKRRAPQYQKGAEDAAQFLFSNTQWLLRELSDEKLDLRTAYKLLQDRLEPEGQRLCDFGDTASSTMDNFLQTLILAADRGKVRIGVIDMSQNIRTGGSAIININSVLVRVKQIIGDAQGLNSSKKTELDGLVESMRVELEKLDPMYTDQAEAIASALEYAVANGSKTERKRDILQFAVDNLSSAAKLVKDVAPAIVTISETIGSFLLGLLS
jgi:hypothetical protein